MPRLVLLGPPGAGKGTQAQALGTNLAIPAISTGEIFRKNVRGGSELGLLAKQYMDAGDLVPDEVTCGMVRDRLLEEDARRGWLLDGFPRSIPQAKALDAMLLEWRTPLSVVIELVVEEDEVVRRLSGRRTCRQCSRMWHVDFDPPEEAGVCDNCGGDLFQRDDDKPSTIVHRLHVYKLETAPLTAFYGAQGLLVGIDATGPVEDVRERMLESMLRFDA